MSLPQMLEQLNPDTIAAFVRAVRNMIDALLIEGERVASIRTPAPRDYANRPLDRSTPAGGWLAPEELRGSAQRLSEAIAAEKWIDGFRIAVMLLTQLRP